MNDYIERYVDDVTRRLPEKDREEVSKELKSNIYDMLSDNADENEIKSVLNNMGSPAILAEKYRTKPRYLISPAIYDEYIHALRWILPLAGGIGLLIGMILGAIGSIKDDMISISRFISEIISEGISMGFSVTFQALIWTTLGFFIADRTGVRVNEKKEKIWQVEDLPEIIPNTKSRISLSDSIVELVLILFISFLAVLYCKGLLPFDFLIKRGNVEIKTIFSNSFLSVCIPIIIVSALFDIAKCIMKIIHRSWTSFVCGVVVVSSLVNMSLMLYLLNRSDIFSIEFTDYIKSIEWGSYDVMRFIGKSGSNPILLTIAIVIVICTLLECGKAVYRTYNHKLKKAI